MDLLLLMLIIVAVIAVSGWGYGTYAHRPDPGPAASGDVVAAPIWVNPLGILGAIAVVAVLMMLITGWRPMM